MKEHKNSWHVAVATEPQSRYGRDTINGCIQYIEETNSQIKLTLICEGFEDPEQLAQRFDAFLLSSRSPWIYPYISNRPIVHLDLQNPMPHELSVSSDAEGTGQLAADLLWNRGVASFGYCHYFASPETGTKRCSTARLKGFVQGLTTWGIPEAEQHVQCHTLCDIQELLEWINNLPRPAGIFAFNDKAALEVLQACSLLGLQVPHEVAVVGVDNDPLICNLMHPSISSIDINLTEVAYQGLAVLEQLLAGTAPVNKHATIPLTRAVLRESTGHFKATVDSRLTRAVQYVHKHAHQGVSVTDIVKASGLSHRVLEIQFKEQLGRTPQEELIHARHRYCLKELRVNQASIERISATLGMSYSSFYRSFKKIEGCTPAEYRDYYKGGEAPIRRINRKNPDIIQIGMVSSLQWQTSRDFISGATTYAQTDPGINLVLHDPHSTGPFAKRVWYDGAIVVAGDEFSDNANSKTPVIYLDYKQSHAEMGCMQVDQFDIGRLAGRHFLRKGHYNFAYCAPFDIKFGSSHKKELDLLDRRSRDRHDGFRSALDDADLEQNSIHTHIIDDASESLLDWLQQLPKPVALFCFNDKLALKVQTMCLAHNISVPAEIAILGVNNNPGYCRLAHPALSSIDIGFARIGAHMLKQFVGYLRNEQMPDTHIFPAQMVHERKSTARLAVDDSKLRRATEYIETHFQETISVNDIAAAVGIERRPLEIRFKKYLRSTPHRYLQETRLIHAEELLIYSSLRINEIADQCGFKQLNHFCRIFREQYDVTPSEFRKKRGALKTIDLVQSSSS